MAQSTTLRRNGAAAAKISNPMSKSRIMKGPRRSGAANTCRCVAIGLALGSVFVCAWLGYSDYGANVADDSQNDDLNPSALRHAIEEGQPLLSSAISLSKTDRRASGEDGKHRKKRHAKPLISSASSDSKTNQRTSEDGGTHKKKRHAPSSIDAVLEYLLALAQQSPAQLWDTLGLDATPGADASYGTNPFALRELERGRCPWSGAERVEWLPPAPTNSEEIAAAYRSRTDLLMSDTARMRVKAPHRRQTDHLDSEQEMVLIWYEHISKAGGTSFCGMANSNMPVWAVPRYHCMPRKGKLMDGRVGTWTNQEVVDHVRKEKHVILANEWEPFSLEKLKLSGRTVNEKEPPAKLDSPQLLFLTTLRDPQDRLLSAYTFFARAAGPKGDGKVHKDGKVQSYAHWINNNRSRLQNTRTAFRASIARKNHIVWRFSGGALPSQKNRESEWKMAFDTAVRSLAQQDLILPMDLMSREEGKQSLGTLLGWQTFEATVRGRAKNQEKGDKQNGHVVTTGGVKNSNARSHFSAKEYRAQWEENWLDNLLYLWCRAVFLARLHCDK